MTFRTRLFLCFGLLLVCNASRLLAQEVVSGIFGFYKLDLLGNSDTIVSIPFARLEVDSALVSSTNSGNVIQVQGTPGWTTNQFVYSSGVQSNTYFVRFKSGVLEGQQFDIAANGTNSLTVNLAGGSLSGVLANDQISIVPHWTFGTVFVNGNGIHPTTTLSRKTEVFVPNNSGTGKNLSPIATYYYSSNTTDGSTAWLTTTTGTNNHNNDVIQPNSYLMIRHNVSTNSTFVSLGDVILTKVAVPLRGNLTNQQDNFIGLVRPLAVSLNDSGLISNGVFTMSVGLTRKDELYVFDNTITGKNKSPVGTYYYLTNAGWRKTIGSSSIDYGTSNIFSPGVGFFIRKAANSTPVSYWLNSPTY